MHAMYGKAVFDFNAIGGPMEPGETASTGWAPIVSHTALTLGAGRRRRPRRRLLQGTLREGVRVPGVPRARFQRAHGRGRGRRTKPARLRIEGDFENNAWASPPGFCRWPHGEALLQLAKNVDCGAGSVAPGMLPVDAERQYYDDALALSQRRAGEEMAPVRRPRWARRTDQKARPRPTWRGSPQRKLITFCFPC